MIMSIPVINKVKILSQISPHLPPPSITSPPQEVRGSVVAIEGTDLTTVMSMTNALAEELERDGSFAVRIFGGPDPYSLCDANGIRVPKKRLSIAETLNIIGEWHKISEEMKRFITRPVAHGYETPINTSSTQGAQKSATIADGNPSEMKTPSRRQSMHAISHDSNESETSPRSIISPRTISQTADLKLATPPNHRYSLSQPQSERDQPFTRVPAAAFQSQSLPRPDSPKGSSVPASRFGTAPPPLPPTPTAHITTPKSALPPVSSTTTAHILPCPSTAPASATPIPIALVPHYQLTTVDTAAIALPISDSYSPLAHWQWLAFLWRGCIGPDVSVVIKGPTAAGEASSSGTGEIRVEDSRSPAATVSGGGVGASGNSDSKKDGTGNASIGSADGFGKDATNNTSTARSSLTASDTRGSTSSLGSGQGVDVKLLEFRTVVVRMGEGANASRRSGSSGRGSGGGLDAVRDREQAEFWEKAKRRVGFEVGEFLRR
jgi:hypothetical protein